eukprot:13873861-Ditylum_brightwellii.AAC.1
MAANSLTISSPSHFSNHSMQARKWVLVAAIMASLALVKHLFVAQLIVVFVVVMVVWVVIVDLVVEVVTAVFVAAAMASLALAKHLFAVARQYIPFWLYL